MCSAAGGQQLHQPHHTGHPLDLPLNPQSSPLKCTGGRAAAAWAFISVDNQGHIFTGTPRRAALFFTGVTEALLRYPKTGLALEAHRQQAHKLELGVSFPCSACEVQLASGLPVPHHALA